MPRLHTPHCAVCNEDGVTIIRPHHEPDRCKLDKGVRDVVNCPGCYYDDLVSELLTLQRFNLAADPQKAKRDAHEAN